MNLGRYDFGQAADTCVSAAEETMELMRRHPGVKLELEDAEGTFTIETTRAANTIQQWIDDGTIAEMCGSVMMLQLQQATDQLLALDIEDATERVEQAKKRSNMIAFGVFGVGVLGLFWMTARGQGLSGLGESDDVHIGRLRMIKATMGLETKLALSLFGGGRCTKITNRPWALKQLKKIYRHSLIVEGRSEAHATSVPMESHYDKEADSLLDAIQKDVDVIEKLHKQCVPG